MRTAASAVHADNRLWRDQVAGNASTTIGVRVMNEEFEAAQATTYPWSERHAAALARAGRVNGAEAPPDHALWREQLASVGARGGNDACRAAPLGHDVHDAFRTLERHKDVPRMCNRGLCRHPQIAAQVTGRGSAE